MLLSVSRVFQTGGPGYVVKYTADLELTPNDPRVTVDVLSFYPEDADAALVIEAAAAIRRGAESALKGAGATIRVHRLCIHDVDFVPKMFERFTAQELSLALDDKATH